MTAKYKVFNIVSNEVLFIGTKGDCFSYMVKLTTEEQNATWYEPVNQYH